MRNALLCALLGASCSLTVVHAQVPGMPIRDASTIREVPLAPIGNESLSLDPVRMPRERPTNATPPPRSSAMGASGYSPRTRAVENNSELAEARALRTLTRQGRNARLTIAPPPPAIGVVEGEVVQLPIGIGRLNRLRTPFATVQVKKLGPGQVETQGGAVFVSTDVEEEISLYIMDAAAPARAISLVLTPRSIPPVDVPISFRGDGGQGASQGNSLIPAVAQRADDWEQQQPYTEAITALFRALALRRVPEGYGLESVRGEAPVACRWPGVRLEMQQRLTGAALNAVVLLAANHSSQEVVLKESDCDGAAVRGVAAWPKNILAPGEETEVFVALGRVEADGSIRRPSLLSAGEL